MPVITIEIPSTPKFLPPKVGGDADFDGHGPNVRVSAGLAVRNGQELWATVTMHAKETKRDYTEVNGSATFLMYRHPGPITRIVSDTFSEAFYTDSNHEDDVLTLGAGELVRAFLCVGDTKGGEAGSRTGVAAYFNPVDIEVP